jgi:hypothetical protein
VIRAAPDRRAVEERLGVADRHLTGADGRLRRVEAAVLPRSARDLCARALAEKLLRTMRRSREVTVAHRRTLSELASIAEDAPTDR